MRKGPGGCRGPARPGSAGPERTKALHRIGERACGASEGRCCQPCTRAWLSYLAALSLAEDDHDWQALLQWKTPGAGERRAASPYRLSPRAHITPVRRFAEWRRRGSDHLGGHRPRWQQPLANPYQSPVYRAVRRAGPAGSWAPCLGPRQGPRQGSRGEQPRSPPVAAGGRQPPATGQGRWRSDGT